MATKRTKGWKEKQACRFYNEGNSCRLGNKCLYFHVDATVDLRTVESGGENTPASLMKWTNKKVVPCEFYLRARSCRFGDFCKYLHDPAAAVLPPIQHDEYKYQEVDEGFTDDHEHFPALGINGSSQTSKQVKINGYSTQNASSAQEKLPEQNDSILINSGFKEENLTRSVAPQVVPPTVEAEKSRTDKKGDLAPETLRTWPEGDSLNNEGPYTEDSMREGEEDSQRRWSSKDASKVIENVVTPDITNSSGSSSSVTNNRKPSSLEQRLQEIEARQKRKAERQALSQPARPKMVDQTVIEPVTLNDPTLYSSRTYETNQYAERRVSHFGEVAKPFSEHEDSGLSAYEREILELKRKLEILELKNKIEALERAQVSAKATNHLNFPSHQGRSNALDSFSSHPHLHGVDPLASLGNTTSGNSSASSVGDAFFENSSFAFGATQSSGRHMMGFHSDPSLHDMRARSNPLNAPSIEPNETYSWKCSRCASYNSARFDSCGTCFLQRGTVIQPKPLETLEPRSAVPPPPGFGVIAGGGEMHNQNNMTLESKSMSDLQTTDNSNFESYNAQPEFASNSHRTLTNTLEPENMDTGFSDSGNAVSGSDMYVDDEDQNPKQSFDDPERREEENYEEDYIIEDTVTVEETQESSYNVESTAYMESESFAQEETVVASQEEEVKPVKKWNELFRKPVSTNSMTIPRVEKINASSKSNPSSNIPKVPRNDNTTITEPTFAWICVHCHTSNSQNVVACKNCYFSKFSQGNHAENEESEGSKERKLSISKENEGSGNKSDKNQNMWKCVSCSHFNDPKENECGKCHTRKVAAKVKNEQKKTKKGKKTADSSNSTSDFKILDYVPDQINEKKSKKKKESGSESMNDKPLDKSSTPAQQKVHEVKVDSMQSEKDAVKSNAANEDAKTVKAAELKQEGDVHLKKKKYKNALKCYIQACDEDPSNPLLLNSCGNVYLILKNPEEALSCFQKSQNLDDRHFKCYLGMGQAHFQLGQLQKSKSAFTKAIKLRGKAKSECDAQMKEIESLLKQAANISDLIKRNKWVQVEEKLTDGFKRVPKCEEFLELQREYEARRVEEKAEETKEIKEDLRLLMSYADNNVLLTKAFCKALEVMQQLPEDGEAYYLLSQVLYRQGELERAIQNAKRAVQLDSTNAIFIQHLQECEHLRRTVLLSQSRFEEGSYQGSYDACRIGLHNLHVENYESKLRLQLRLLAGDNLIRLVRLPEARIYFEKIIAEDSKLLESGTAHLNLALCIYSETVKGDCNLVETLEKVLSICKAGMGLANSLNEQKRFSQLQQKTTSWLEAIRKNDNRICPCCGRFMHHDSGSEDDYDEDEDYDEEDDDDRDSIDDDEDDDDDDLSYIDDSVDYYKALGVERTATLEKIADAFKNISVAFAEPERFKNDEERANAFRSFRDGVTAYKVLSDPVMRFRYDNGTLTKQDVSHCTGFNHFMNLLDDMGLIESFRGACR